MELVADVPGSTPNWDMITGRKEVVSRRGKLRSEVSPAFAGASRGYIRWERDFGNAAKMESSVSAQLSGKGREKEEQEENSGPALQLRARRTRAPTTNPSPSIIAISSFPLLDEVFLHK